MPWTHGFIFRALLPLTMEDNYLFYVGISHCQQKKMQRMGSPGPSCLCRRGCILRDGRLTLQLYSGWFAEEAMGWVGIGRSGPIYNNKCIFVPPKKKSLQTAAASSEGETCPKRIPRKIIKCDRRPHPQLRNSCRSQQQWRTGRGDDIFKSFGKTLFLSSLGLPTKFIHMVIE